MTVPFGARDDETAAGRPAADGLCPACGIDLGTGLDRVDDRERALWDAVDRAEQLETAPLHPVGRPSEVVRAHVEAEQAAAAGDEARVALAGHLDHLLAAYAQSPSPPFWFVHGVGLPTGRQSIADWAERSRAVVGYRRRYGVTDPLRPLGEDPADRSPRAARWAELAQHPSPVR